MHPSEGAVSADTSRGLRAGKRDQNRAGPPLPLTGRNGRALRSPPAQFPARPELTATGPSGSSDQGTRLGVEMGSGGAGPWELAAAAGGAGRGGADPAPGRVAGAHWLGPALPRPRGQGGPAAPVGGDSSHPTRALASRPASPHPSSAR